MEREVSIGSGTSIIRRKVHTCKFEYNYNISVQVFNIYDNKTHEIYKYVYDLWYTM